MINSAPWPGADTQLSLKDRAIEIASTQTKPTPSGLKKDRAFEITLFS